MNSVSASAASAASAAANFFTAKAQPACQRTRKVIPHIHADQPARACTTRQVRARDASGACTWGKEERKGKEGEKSCTAAKREPCARGIRCALEARPSRRARLRGEKPVGWSRPATLFGQRRRECPTLELFPGDEREKQLEDKHDGLPCPAYDRRLGARSLRIRMHRSQGCRDLRGARHFRRHLARPRAALGLERRWSGPVPREGPPPMAVPIIAFQAPEGSPGDPLEDFDALRADLSARSTPSSRRNGKSGRGGIWPGAGIAAQAAKPAPQRRRAVSRRAAAS